MNYIKTNNKWSRQRGTTLVELSVVIAVILLLVGVLFIGVQAWRDGANKSACLVNQASIQKAVRGYQNMHLLNPGDPLAITDLQNDKYFGTTMPTCPVGNTAYTAASSTVPNLGVPYVTCANGHTPTAAQLSQW